MIVCAAAVALTACQTPEHTNTLIFGTNTKIALDVSVNPAGGTPDITLGYKRQEAVWMPLLANQGKPDEREPASCAIGSTEDATESSGGSATGKFKVTDTDNCVFVSSDKLGYKKDAYSVLASFDAKFASDATGASAGAPSASASGGLAQFFATGVAAQKLAEQGGAKLVSVQPGDVDEAVVKALVEDIMKERLASLQDIERFVDDGSGNVSGDKRQALAQCLADQGNDINLNWLNEFDGRPVPDFAEHLVKEWNAFLNPIGKCVRQG